MAKQVSVHSFSEALKVLGTRDRRKLENHTYLEKRDADRIAVKLHLTDVVMYHSDGRVVLNSGGWRTVTTKARIDCNLPDGFTIWTDRGVWYVGKGTWSNRSETVVYADGLTIEANGTVSSQGEMPKDFNKLKRSIGQYARGYTAALIAGKVGAPDLSDCFYCGMKEVGTEKPIGECFQDKDHILSHLEEKYFVPSLAWNAMNLLGASVACKHDVSVLMSGGEGEQRRFGAVEYQLPRLIRRYVTRQLGMQA